MVLPLRELQCAYEGTGCGGGGAGVADLLNSGTPEPCAKSTAEYELVSATWSSEGPMGAQGQLGGCRRA